VWSGQHNKYRIEQHDLSGGLQAGFVRRVHWFPDWGAPSSETYEGFVEFLSRPRSLGVRQTADSLLWAHVIMVDDPEKIPLPSSLNQMEGPPDGLSPAVRQMMSELVSNFVTMVEAIDPGRRTVLASREMAGIVVPMQRDLVAQMRLDQYGDWSCVVMKLSVAQGR
jgi:hypothetical protein